MTDLSAMLHLTKDEEQRLLSIAKERKKKKMEAENRRNSYGTQSDPDRRRKM